MMRGERERERLIVLTWMVEEDRERRAAGGMVVQCFKPSSPAGGK